jgi:hypothetical protein
MLAPIWKSSEPHATRKEQAVRLLALSLLSAIATSAAAETRQVVGYAGVLGEWELVADVSEASTGEFSGPATMTHVGLCTQDGPERKLGDIRLRIGASRLNATLSLAGIECTYSASLSDAYKGQMSCPGRAPEPLTLWLR